MRILIALALAIAAMVAVTIAILAIGTAITRATDGVTLRGSKGAGAVPKVAFVLLWCLVAGIALGMIGGS